MLSPYMYTCRHKHTHNVYKLNVLAVIPMDPCVWFSEAYDGSTLIKDGTVERRGAINQSALQYSQHISNGSELSHIYYCILIAHYSTSAIHCVLCTLAAMLLCHRSFLSVAPSFIPFTVAIVSFPPPTCPNKCNCRNYSR